jgi:hypothetical protein
VAAQAANPARQLSHGSRNSSLQERQQLLALQQQLTQVRA